MVTASYDVLAGEVDNHVTDFCSAEHGLSATVKPWAGAEWLANLNLLQIC